MQWFDDILNGSGKLFLLAIVTPRVLDTDDLRLV